MRAWVHRSTAGRGLGLGDVEHSTDVPGAADARPRRANDYDAFAAAYAAENDNSLANAYYERPAMLELAGDVRGRSVLDVGCGSGALSAALRDRGATVTGMDASAAMLDLASRRLGRAPHCTWLT